MTATPDDARAREIAEQIRGLCVDLGGAFPLRTITALLTTALTEARDQGAREAAKTDADFEKWVDDRADLIAGRMLQQAVIHFEEQSFKATGIIRRALLATPSPAIAPLREAVVEAAMKWFDAPEYTEDEANYMLADACAALFKAQEAAQGAAAEERTP